MPPPSLHCLIAGRWTMSHFIDVARSQRSPCLLDVLAPSLTAVAETSARLSPGVQPRSQALCGSGNAARPLA